MNHPKDLQPKYIYSSLGIFYDKLPGAVEDQDSGQLYPHVQPL